MTASNQDRDNRMPQDKDEKSPWPGWKPGMADTGPSRHRSDQPDRPDKMDEGGDLAAHDFLEDQAGNPQDQASDPARQEPARPRIRK